MVSYSMLALLVLLAAMLLAKAVKDNKMDSTTNPDPFYFTDQADFEKWTPLAIDKVSEIIGFHPSCNGLPVSPKIYITPDKTPFNARCTLDPAGDSMNLVIPWPTFERCQGHTIVLKFAWLHELSHCLTEHVLGLESMSFAKDAIDGHGVSGAAVEVLADLLAVRILAQLGTPVGQIKFSVQRYGFKYFDKGWNEDHPPASQRIKYIIKILNDAMSPNDVFAYKLMDILLGLDEQSPAFCKSVNKTVPCACKRSMSTLAGECL